MRPYAQLTRVSFEYAITEMADLTLREHPKDKVLVVPIRLMAENYSTDECFMREFAIVIYRPTNYTFVGMILDYMITDGEEIEFETDHDSCWRDGINRIVRRIASEIDKDIEEADGDEMDFHVHTSFGIISPKLVDGYVKSDKSERTSTFHKIEKE